MFASVVCDVGRIAAGLNPVGGMTLKLKTFGVCEYRSPPTLTIGVVRDSMALRFCHAVVPISPPAATARGATW